MASGWQANKRRYENRPPWKNRFDPRDDDIIPTKGIGRYWGKNDYSEVPLGIVLGGLGVILTWVLNVKSDGPLSFLTGTSGSLIITVLYIAAAYFWYRHKKETVLRQEELMRQLEEERQNTTGTR